MLSRILSWSRTPSIASTSDQSPAASSPSGSDNTSSESGESSRGREPVHLPDEIVLEILSYFPEGKHSQSTLRAACLVSHQWHNLAVGTLYACPNLHGWNYEPFVRQGLRPNFYIAMANFSVHQNDLSLQERTYTKVRSGWISPHSRHVQIGVSRIEVYDRETSRPNQEQSRGLHSATS